MDDLWADLADTRKTLAAATEKLDQLIKKLAEKTEDLVVQGGKR